MRRGRRGLSLAELLVAMFVMGIVVWGAYEIFREGIQFFKTNQKAADAQRHCLNLLSQVSLQVTNAKDDLVRSYNGPGVVQGICFASPLADDGKVHYDLTNGNQVFWQKICCFYLDPSNNTVYRKEVKIPDTVSGETGNSDLGQVGSQLDAATSAYFLALSTPATRIVAKEIRSLDVKVYDPSTSGVVPGGAGSAGAAGGLAFDITVEAGNPTDRGPNGYYIKLDTRVAPRG